MRFNKYIWDLYKHSANGQENINKWTILNDFPDKEYCRESKPTIIDELRKNNLENYICDIKVNWYKMLKDYFINHDFNRDDVRDIYEKWVKEGISVNDVKVIGENKCKNWTIDVSFFSQILFASYPDYFFPYILNCEFEQFKKICNEFSIPIPEVPNKNNWEKRAMFYIDICEALFEFRKMNKFTPGELCAFFYDFAPTLVNELEDSEMPNPSKAWFVGGSKYDFNFLDNATFDSKDRWQCNVDARKGDIIVMYCVTPRSYIHSIWRACGDGFADPFFQYYSVVQISNPIKLDFPINQKDLINNTIWSKNPLIRKNLQGVNGYPIKHKEYLELLSMMKEKGQDVDILPTIKPTNKFEGDELFNERDVEIKLIEPFLLSLKYKPSDWIRQMPVKMGRGERNYPDYCFNANPQRGNENATMILESKYEIKTQKELKEAYFQAKSYALRLRSDKFIVASREGIWIFLSQNSVFKFENNYHRNWLEIEDPDVFYVVRKMIGK